VSGIQQPARNVVRQLPNSGLLGSGQLVAPLELDDEDVDDEDVDDEDEDVDEPFPPEPVDVPPPVPVGPVEEPHAAHVAAITAKRNHERDIRSSLVRGAPRYASREPRGIEARSRAPAPSRRRFDA
jgi:hypothetical protein